MLVVALESSPIRWKGMTMPAVLGVNVSASSYEELVRRCSDWAQNRESRTVLFVGMHGLMEAHDDPAFRAALNTADLANPDGMPVVWALRSLGLTNAARVYGPDATVELLRAAQQNGTPVGFYGGDEVTLARLVEEVERRYSGIDVA